MSAVQHCMQPWENGAVAMTRGKPVLVKWRAENERLGISTTGWNESLLPSWADCEGNSESAVNSICEDYFNSAEMECWFAEEGDGDVLVEVSAPESIAGSYDVHLHRITKANARRML